MYIQELSKVNGSLFQKIGFEEKDEKTDGEEDEEQITIDDLIDEKGEIIDE